MKSIKLDLKEIRNKAVKLHLDHEKSSRGIQEHMNSEEKGTNDTENVNSGENITEGTYISEEIKKNVISIFISERREDNFSPLSSADIDTDDVMASPGNEVVETFPEDGSEIVNQRHITEGGASIEEEIITGN